MAKSINPILKQVPKKGKRNKFNATKTLYNKKVYDSKKEAHYRMRLDLQRRAQNKRDKVVSIEEQVRYDIILPCKLNKKDMLMCFYLLDFKVGYADGRIEHIDVKGTTKGCVYQHFRLKKKLVQAQYGITIIEK